MELQEVTEELQAICNRSETPEDISREIDLLSPDRKQRMVYAIALKEFDEDVRQHSLSFIDWCERNQAVNDYVQQRSKPESILGMLRALTLLRQNTGHQARLEMQTQNADSQFGMKLAERINELACEVEDITSEITTLFQHYQAVLIGRGMDVHYTWVVCDFLSPKPIATTGLHDFWELI